MFDPDQEHRLHPWSWLFVLLQQVRQFIVPLLVLVVFGGRGERDDVWEQIGPIVAMVILVVVSLLRYLTYRYRIGRDGLSIRSGWLHRSAREIPYARIHNVVVHQSVLHRLFGVAELRLESAGGSKPEAEMRVLRLDQALALEEQLRHRGRPAAPPGDTEAPAPAREELLALSTAEVVRLGLVSNRGMIALAAAFGATYQAFPRHLVADVIERFSHQVTGYASHLKLGWMAGGLTVALLTLFALAALRALSVTLALLQYSGFRLSESERRLTVERGLLARLRTSVARRRIQAWHLEEGVLHRLFRRRSLHIDTAVAEFQGAQSKALKELAPLAPPDTCDGLVRHLLPEAQWPPSQWQALPVSGWWRLWLPGLYLIAPLSLVLCWHLGAWGALPLLWLPWSAFASWQQARRLAYAVDARLVSVRGGWWTRWWRFAEIDKLQALRLGRTPLDRACGTASLWLDTAGATGNAPPLRIRFLPQAQAEALYRQLGRALAQRRLRW